MYSSLFLQNVLNKYGHICKTILQEISSRLLIMQCFLTATHIATYHRHCIFPKTLFHSHSNVLEMRKSIKSKQVRTETLCVGLKYLEHLKDKSVSCLQLTSVGLICLCQTYKDYFGKHRQSRVHKTYCFPRSQSISVKYVWHKHIFSNNVHSIRGNGSRV